MTAKYSKQELLAIAKDRGSQFSGEARSALIWAADTLGAADAVLQERDAEIERLIGVAFLASAERDEARMEISSLKVQKPIAYGIRQITDDEGVEEWEDIRTSPDVAKDEADGMMETGRGERYEVIPLYRTAGAQASVTCQIYGHVVGACLECNTHSEVDELQETIEAQRKVLGQALPVLRGCLDHPDADDVITAIQGVLKCN